MAVYRFTEYDNADIGEIQALYSKAFADRYISSNCLIQKFELKPDCKCRMLNLWSDNRLIGHITLNVNNAYVCGKEQLVACSGTLMADKDYPGVSVKLLKECQKRNFDISVIYGFPNANAYQLTLRLGHNAAGKMSVWERANVNKVRETIAIRKIDTFTHSYNEIVRRLSKQFSVVTSRKTNYLNWRFFGNIEKHYDVFEAHNGELICGYVVLNTYAEKHIRYTQIIDILADSKDTFIALLNYANTYSLGQRNDFLHMWMSSKEFQPILRDEGFVESGQSFNMTTWTEPINLDESYITMADSDIF